MAHHVLNSR